MAGAVDGENGSGSFAAVRASPVPDGPGSGAGPPGEFGHAFLIGDNKPPGDFGVQNHAFMVGAGAAAQQ